MRNFLLGSVLGILLSLAGTSLLQFESTIVHVIYTPAPTAEAIMECNREFEGDRPLFLVAPENGGYSVMISSTANREESEEIPVQVSAFFRDLDTKGSAE
jgi:hypothetical protein